MSGKPLPDHLKGKAWKQTEQRMSTESKLLCIIMGRKEYDRWSRMSLALIRAKLVVFGMKQKWFSYNPN